MQNHVETLAIAWAEHDGLESWMLAAPDARPLSRETLQDIVSDYLASHDPFPDGMNVEVARQDGSGWEPAVIIERPVETTDAHVLIRVRSTEMRPGNITKAPSLRQSSANGLRSPTLTRLHADAPEQYSGRPVSWDRRRSILLKRWPRPFIPSEAVFCQCSADFLDLRAIP